MIALGRFVKDSITGLVGVATARVMYLNGEDSILVEPIIGKDGEAQASVWFVESRLGTVSLRGRPLKEVKRGRK